MSLRKVLGSAALLAAALVSAGCGNETILLATVPVTDSGAPPPTSTPCTTSQDCPATAFCELPECNPPAGTAGTCKAIPEVCNEPEGYECGCDNVTYWSDCLRRKSGIGWYSASAPCPFDLNSPCGIDVPNSVACPTGAFCAQLGGSMHGSPGQCDHPFPGTCWVLPDVCPGAAEPDTDRWDSCSADGPKCQDTCSAIRAGGSFRQSALQCQ